jgi:hypothetical protein
MTTKQKKAYLKKNWLKETNIDMAKKLGVGVASITRWARDMELPEKKGGVKKAEAEVLTPQERIELDKQKKKQEQHDKAKKQAYDFALTENDRLKSELEAALQLKDNISPVVYEYKPLTSDTESVAVVLASDWHIEERVRPEVVNGLNNFSVNIARKRAEQFFQNTLKLVEKERYATKIDTLVLALLGDFISGNIHEELLENCELQPIDAMIEAENMILSGIQYLLDNSDLRLIIPCHVGNHTRITRKVHISTESGNSLETIMYHHLKNHFKDNDRVEVLISPSYLSYLDLWGYTICFSHGHAVKYGGGVGGLTIPLRKAIAQWQKTRRADLYCIGHWHQYLDIGEAIVNGSLVGYNAFAVFIKAEYERPKQAFFLINRKYNQKTVVCPILFNQ